VLARADAIAAEDTRETRKLMQIHGIPLAGRPMLSYNDRNATERRPRIVAWLREGRSVAYCSDAGTPLVADPGYRLVEAALAEGLDLIAVPGASALLTALSLAGLPTDRFLFAGFLPTKAGARKTALTELAQVPATLIFYESPRRLADSLVDMAEALGGARRAAVARELTKRFEQVRRDLLGALAAAYAAEAAPKGKVVVLVGPPDPAARGTKVRHRWTGLWPRRSPLSRSRTPPARSPGASACPGARSTPERWSWRRDEYAQGTARQAQLSQRPLGRGSGGARLSAARGRDPRPAPPQRGRGDRPDPAGERWSGLRRG